MMIYLTEQQFDRRLTVNRLYSRSRQRDSGSQTHEMLILCYLPLISDNLSVIMKGADGEL